MYHQQKNLRIFCKKHDIQITAYAPLESPGTRSYFHPEKNTDDFMNPKKLEIVMKIAENHNKTVTQVLLNHLVQSEAVIIPSTKSIKHLKENLQVVDFSLNDLEMKELDRLDKGDDGKIFDYKFLKG